MADHPTALVTGSTGYIGSRLVAPLLAAGWRVRVLTRDASRLRAHTWVDDVEVVEGDASSSDDVARALTDVDVAYYLVHSMGGADADFARRDRDLAVRFAAVAGQQDVGRIVYLGGLHPAGEDLSPHLASRKEVGDVFLGSPVPAAVLQAAVIVGAGSASFEMMRHLSERLPLMVAPRWIRNRIQPIAVRDVLRFLVAAGDLPSEVNRAFDVGGPDILTYADMVQRFAAAEGLGRRTIVSVPVLTPRLAGHWVGLVTPMDAGLARPLVDSLVHEVVCDDDDAGRRMGVQGLMGFDEAVRAALRDRAPHAGDAETTDPALSHEADPPWAGTVSLRDDDAGRVVPAPADQVWGRLVDHAAGPSVLARWSRGLRASGIPGYPDTDTDGWSLNAERRTAEAVCGPTPWHPGRVTVRVGLTPEGDATRVRVDFGFVPSGATGHAVRLASTPALTVVHRALRRQLVRDVSRCRADA